MKARKPGSEEVGKSVLLVRLVVLVVLVQTNQTSLLSRIKLSNYLSSRIILDVDHFDFHHENFLVYKSQLVDKLTLS